MILRWYHRAYLNNSAYRGHCLNENGSIDGCNGFGGLGAACWPLVPKFVGSNPDEAIGLLGRKKSSARLRPQFYLSLLGSLASLGTEAPGG